MSSAAVANPRYAIPFGEQDAARNECSSSELVGPFHFRRHGYS